jgi:hypothetical protein
LKKQLNALIDVLIVSTFTNFMKNSLYKLGQFLLSVAVFTGLFSFQSLAQQVEEQIPTQQDIETSLQVLSQKIQGIEGRIVQLQTIPNPTLHEENYILTLKQGKENLLKDQQRLEKIKISIDYAVENNLFLEKDQNAGTGKTFPPAKKVKISQETFEGLPETKKQAVLASPDQYEISN